MSHPGLDGVGVRVRSKLLGTGRVAIEFSFPYGTGQMTAADWTKPDAHRTAFTQPGPNQARFARTLDADTYVASVRWSPAAAMSATGPHTFLLSAVSGADALAVTSTFSPAAPAGPLPTFEEHQCRHASALEPVLVHGRRHRSLGQHRSRDGGSSSGASSCRST